MPNIILDIGPICDKVHYYIVLFAHLSNMLKIKCSIKQQYLKIVYLNFFQNLNNFYSLEVVDRVSETQLQVGKNFNLKILRLKG